MDKKRKKRGGVGNVLLTLGIIACLAVMAYAGYRLFSALYAYRQGEKEYQQLSDTYTSDTGDPAGSDGDQAVTASAGSDSGPEADVPPISVDFDALRQVNEDVVGWLYVPALDISYPIMQGEDDDYYLHRTTERTYNFSGSIFMEAENSPQFDDPNTIIYGHNMKNGSMFGTLSHLLTQKKYKDSPEFWILTPDENYRYQMFSLHETQVGSSVYTLFDGTDQSFVDWAQQMKSQSGVDLGEETFQEDSKIVTLSTCTGNDATRFVVQGVRRS